MLFKKAQDETVSNCIKMKFGTIVLQVNMHKLPSTDIPWYICGTPPIVLLLLQTTESNTKFGFGIVPLATACLQGYTSQMQFLLHKKNW